MRIVTRREDESTRRLIRDLREQLAETTQEKNEQSSANGRLAAANEHAQAELSVANRALTADQHQLLDENARLRARIDQLTEDNRQLRVSRDGLSNQLFHALYDDEQLALIAAGAVSLKKASNPA